MESITFEIASAEGDPYDRTLSILAKHSRTVVIVRSFRVAPEIPLGTVLLWIDRFALMWARPGLDESESIHDLADGCEEALSAPF